MKKLIDFIRNKLGLVRKSEYKKVVLWCQSYQKGFEHWIERYKKADTAARKFRELLLKAEAKVQELEAEVKQHCKCFEATTALIRHRDTCWWAQLAEAQQQPEGRRLGKTRCAVCNNVIQKREAFIQNCQGNWIHEECHRVPEGPMGASQQQPKPEEGK